MKSVQHLRNIIHQSGAATDGYRKARQALMDEFNAIADDLDVPELPPDISYHDWLKECIPSTVYHPLAPHHHRFWQWAWNLQQITYPNPYVCMLGRGGGKSTMDDAFAVYLGALRVRNYILIIRNTQEGKEETIANIKALLASPEIMQYYPELSERKLTKYGNSAGYKKNLVLTQSGIIYRAVSLEEAARGTRYGKFRPDCIIIDDIDVHLDTIKASKKKINLITRTFLPMGSPNCCVLATQNLVKEDGFFGMLNSGEADYLINAEIENPVPSVIDFAWEMETISDNRGVVRKRAIITDGYPSWQGQDLKACQELMDTYGIAAFLRENQHSVAVDPGGMFENDWFIKTDFIPIRPNTIFVRYWDKAATRGAGSFTCGVLMAAIKHGVGFDNASYYVLDEVRGQWAVTEREEMIRETAIKDKAAYGNVKIYLEQSPNAGGKESANNTIMRLPGFVVRADKVITGKTERADGLATQVKIGNVYVLDRPWAQGYINRMVSFPNKTDTGDASSGAFRMLAKGEMQTSGWGG